MKQCDFITMTTPGYGDSGQGGAKELVEERDLQPGDGKVQRAHGVDNRQICRRDALHQVPLCSLLHCTHLWVADGGGHEFAGTRIDAVSEGGSRVTVVQGHDSFRRCVAQSSAEFALDIMCGGGGRPGIHLPEELYGREGADQGKAARARILEKITRAEGTFTYKYEKV